MALWRQGGGVTYKPGLHGRGSTAFRDLGAPDVRLSSVICHMCLSLWSPCWFPVVLGPVLVLCPFPPKSYFKSWQQGYLHKPLMGWMTQVEDGHNPRSLEVSASGTMRTVVLWTAQLAVWCGAEDSVVSLLLWLGIQSLAAPFAVQLAVPWEVEYLVRSTAREVLQSQCCSLNG